MSPKLMRDGWYKHATHYGKRADMTTPSKAPESYNIRFIVIVILSGIALSVPSLLSGLMADDYFFTGGAITPDAPFGYYNFTDKNIATEIQFWWTSPNFKVRLFRPLSSLSLHFDFALMKGNALVAHLHSMAWFVLMLLGALCVYRHILSEKRAKWAGVLFSLSVIHAWNAGWIASRHTVMGGAFAMWAGWAFVRWQRSEKRSFAVASSALFGLGLLTSEAALSFVGFAIAYLTFLSTRPLKDKLKASAWTVAMTVIYLAYYFIMGFGTAGSDLYTDPRSQPLDFCCLFFPKIISLLGAFIVGVPASLRAAPGTESAAMLAGATAVCLLSAGVALSWKRLETPERTAVKGLGLMAFLTLFPGVAGIAMGREFALTGMAVLGIVAVILNALFGVKGTLKMRWLPRTMAVAIFVGVAVLSPLARIGMSALLIIQSNLSSKIGESDTGCKEDAHVLVFSGDLDIPIAYGPHFVGTHQGKFFKSWHQMVLTDSTITISRPRVDRLVLSAEKTLVKTLLLRETDNPLTVGEIIERRFMTIEVLATGKDGPTRIQITFTKPEVLDNVCALKTEAAVLKPLQLPEVGETVVVPYIPAEIS